MSKQNRSQNRNSKYSNNRKGSDAKGLRSKSNDVSWYASDAILLRDSASINFSYPLGVKHDLHTPGLDKKFSIPGLCTIELVPTIGQSHDASASVNIAATALYTKVRHQNSGSSNYDAPDLMLKMLAMTQVYAYINYLQRIYGLVSLYSHRNRYLPRTLVEANGVDFDNVYGNMAGFRYGIELLINKAASFCVPAVMPIFRRMAFLYQNVYAEGSSIKDQLYMFVPGGWWLYQMNPMDGSGMLKMDRSILPNIDRQTVEQLLDYGNKMLAPLLASEDINIMSGDILRAFGENALIKLAPMPLDYTVIPMCDPVVLEQMKNATCIDCVEGFDVTQEPSRHAFLVHAPYVECLHLDGHNEVQVKESIAASLIMEDKVLTTRNAEPGPETVMENSRLMVTGVDNEGTIDLYGGSEIPVACNFWYLDENSESTCDTVWYGNVYNHSSVHSSALALYSTMSAFQYHPSVRVGIMSWDDVSDEGTLTDIYHMWNIDNYTILPKQDLMRIHDAALMNMLAVPNINKYNG